MTKLTLELHPDRRRKSRLSREDWGRYWIQDADTMLVQICAQIRRELEDRVREVAADVHAALDAKSVQVTVAPVRATKPNFAAWVGAERAAAVAVLEAPLVPAHIRMAAETVAMWNKLYVLPVA